MKFVKPTAKNKGKLIPSVLWGVVFFIAALITFDLPLHSASINYTRSIKVKSVPVSFSLVNKAQTSFGKLSWRGGIELISSQEDFGGLSGIVTGLDGTKFVAVSDKGMWISGDIHYGNEKLKSVSNLKISPLRDRRGRPFVKKRYSDAESIAPYGAKGLKGKLLIGFERKQRIGIYNFGKKGLAARERSIKLPKEAKRAKRNKELESVGRFPKGTRLGKTIIAISERFLDNNGNIIGWLIGGPTPGRFSVKRIDNFDITDLTITPDNELIILERYFSTLSGVKMRLRKINTDHIRPGAILDGEVLLETDQRNTIDNMEGLASHRATNGEIRLTLISDDNFNVFQRTLLLQFALKK